MEVSIKQDMLGWLEMIYASWLICLCLVCLEVRNLEKIFLGILRLNLNFSTQFCHFIWSTLPVALCVI